MTVSLVLLIGMVVLYACGVYLLLERSLTRMLLGFLLVGNATNILVFFTSGAFGVAPLYDEDLAPSTYSDPLPQAFILTAIVITFGVTAFLLALIYRSWRLAQEDTVEDDEEDIAMRSIDPTLDDEEFDEEDSGDTEFGTKAEAAVSGASEDVDDLFDDSDDVSDLFGIDQGGVEELQPVEGHHAGDDVRGTGESTADEDRGGTEDRS